MNKARKPIYLRWWFLVIVGLVLATSIFFYAQSKYIYENPFGPKDPVTFEDRAKHKEDAAYIRPANPFPESEFNKVKDKNASFEGTILETNQLKIEITKYEVFAVGEYGNEEPLPILVFWYTVTNKSEKLGDLDVNAAWVRMFDLYLTNNSERQRALSEVDFAEIRKVKDLFEPAEEGLNIKKGESAENVFGYSILNYSEPVELVAKSLKGKELGKIEIDVPKMLESSVNLYDLRPDPIGPRGNLSSKDNTNRIFMDADMPPHKDLSCWTVTVEKVSSGSWQCYSDFNKTSIGFKPNSKIVQRHPPTVGTRLKLYVVRGASHLYVYGYEILY